MMALGDMLQCCDSVVVVTLSVVMSEMTAIDILWHQCCEAVWDVLQVNAMASHVFYIAQV